MGMGYPGSQMNPANNFAGQARPGMMQQHPQQQMMGMNPLQGVRQQQISQLFQFFPNTQATATNATGVDYRIPLVLRRANQPLFVRIHVPHQFPQMAPSIHVMHSVVHEKISKDGKYLYIGERLAAWKSHSNLLSLVRQMHQEFELNPPIPENMLHQGAGHDSQISNASEAPQM